MAPYLMVFYPFLAARRAAAVFRPDAAWRTWVSDHILLGGFLLPTDVAELQRLGIRAVVNVSEELLDPVETLRAAGIAYHQVRCWDMSVPTLECADRGVQFVADHIAQGHRVYIHCASGVGRSVLLTLCYLAEHEGLDASEALARLTSLRPRINMKPLQREFVDSYVAWRRNRGHIPESFGGAATPARPGR